jgi:hypothetical protein
VVFKNCIPIFPECTLKYHSISGTQRNLRHINVNFAPKIPPGMSKGRESKPHIGIYGRRNNGKSSLINCLAGKDITILSDHPNFQNRVSLAGSGYRSIRCRVFLSYQMSCFHWYRHVRDIITFRSYQGKF